MFKSLYNIIRRAYYAIGIGTWIIVLCFHINANGFFWQFRSWDNFLLSCALWIGPVVFHLVLRWVVTGKALDR